jgi:predicted PurR-regulated permease PerM
LQPGTNTGSALLSVEHTFHKKDETMQTDVQRKEEQKTDTTPLVIWTKRLVISLTILVWIVLAGLFFWLIGRVAQAMLLLAIGALLAYTIYPLVKLLQRVLPRPLAIAVVYLLVLGVLSILVYLVIITFIDQVTSLIQFIRSLINGNRTSQLQPVFDTLRQFGVSQQQLRDFGQQILGQLQSVVGNVIPVVTNVFNVFLNTVLVAMLSIYFLLSGPRAIHWLKTNTPASQRPRIQFLLDTLATVIGGYIRGNVLLATVISTLTGVGIALVGVPYPFLLAVLTFILEFIPVIGIYITSVAVVLLAFTQGWVTGLLALGIVLLLQLLENNVFAPRIVGRAVGINPIITIFALIAGTNLFGIAGAFFAAPVAGIAQALIQALWSDWRAHHPEQFPTENHDRKQQKSDRNSDTASFWS